MQTFRSPHLMSHRMTRGWTRPWWIVLGWLIVMLVVLPLGLIVFGVHDEWFAHSSVLYTLHDEFYLPLRGRLFLLPWPYSLIPWGFAFALTAAFALPFLVGRSPLKQGYLWCVRAILIVLSRMPWSVTRGFLVWWMKWGRARHAAWPLVADEIRVTVRRRFDAHPHKRAWWLAELVRWTVLTMQLRRAAATPAEAEAAWEGASWRIRWERMVKWLRSETVLADSFEFLRNLPHRLWRGVVDPDAMNSGADSLSRRDRIRNAQAWTEAVVRLTAVSTAQAARDQSGRPALLTGQWGDVFRRSEGTLRDRAALAWYLLRQQPNLEELVTWLQRDVADCVPDGAPTSSLPPESGTSPHNVRGNGDESGQRCGLDFDSAARDLACLIPLLSELARRTSIDGANAQSSPDESQGDVRGDTADCESHPAVIDDTVMATDADPAENPRIRNTDEDRHSRLNSLSPDCRRTLRKLAARSMQRRKLIEQTLRELEAHAFHSFASALPADRVPLEGDPEVASLCLNLALIPTLLTGEAGPLTGLIEAIDAFHLMWSLSVDGPTLQSAEGCTNLERSRPTPAAWQDLHAALQFLPGSDVRKYCREMQTELFGSAADSVSESVLRGSSVVRGSDVDVLRDRAALVDRVSASA